MRNLFVSFKKIITSRGFWLCVGMTVLLLFSAEVYTDYDTQDRYSVFRALTSLSREELCAEQELCGIMVIQNARGGWFTLFAPIITAFCFVPTMCAEREENAVRFQIFRTAKLKYSITKFLSGIISGGLAMALGYVIFSGAAMLLFPNVSEMTDSAKQMLGDITLDFPRLVVTTWLFGAFWSVPPMFLTSVLRNKYLVICIPFFLKYGLTQSHHKILENTFSAEEIDEKMMKLANFIAPDGLLWINESTRLNVISLFGIVSVLFFAAYIIIMQKRGDCGA